MKIVAIGLAMWLTTASIDHERALHRETCCFKDLQGQAHCLPCDVYHWLTFCKDFGL